MGSSCYGNDRDQQDIGLRLGRYQAEVITAQRSRNQRERHKWSHEILRSEMSVVVRRGDHSPLGKIGVHITPWAALSKSSRTGVQFTLRNDHPRGNLNALFSHPAARDRKNSRLPALASGTPRSRYVFLRFDGLRLVRYGFSSARSRQVHNTGDAPLMMGCMATVVAGLPVFLNFWQVPLLDELEA